MLSLEELLSDCSEWTTLVREELEWVRYQPFLEKHGYMLRPRYRPDWVPEALTSGKEAWDCEDSKPTWGAVLDATRISDGAQVVLKKVETESTEVHISKYLTNHPGEGTHAITVLEVIPMPDNVERAFLVMPRMRVCDYEPYFKTVLEFTEFLQQVLEGLVYFHSKNIAHRDICPNNIVVDPSRIIPGGFHFACHGTSDGVHVLREYRADSNNTHFFRTRTEAGPMKYYYIDFGLAVWYPSFEARGLVTGQCGQRGKHIPELSATIPYDPFKVDVRSVGEMLRKDFLLEYTGLDFLIPFVVKLRRHNPARRPDAAKALAMFQCLVASLSEEQLAQPLVWYNRNSKRKMLLFLKGLGLH